MCQRPRGRWRFIHLAGRAAAHNSHDANCLTLHRVAGFRALTERHEPQRLVHGLLASACAKS